MKNRETRIIEEIIARFHSKRFRKKVEHDFYHWLLLSEDWTAKDEAMMEVWSNIPHSVTRSVYRSLDAVKSRLGMAVSARKRAQLNRRGVMARVAAVLLPTVLLLGSYLVYNNAGRVELVRMDVPYGQTGYHMLADGTEVWLNAGSYLEYPVKFKGRNREVNLYGEGFFDVARDAKKPFIVHTGYMDTRVVGTEFNISCYESQRHESITVLTGQIEVTTRDEKVHSLVPNRHLTHWIESGETHIEEVDASSMICWRNNGLVFEDSTYEEMLCALSRKYDFRVTIDSAYLTGSIYRMQFINDEPLEYILDVIHSVVGLPYKLENGVLVVGSDQANAREIGLPKQAPESVIKNNKRS